jgi:hypothetical protein
VGGLLFENVGNFAGVDPASACCALSETEICLLFPKILIGRNFPFVYEVTLIDEACRCATKPTCQMTYGDLSFGLVVLACHRRKAMMPKYIIDNGTGVSPLSCVFRLACVMEDVMRKTVLALGMGAALSCAATIAHAATVSIADVSGPGTGEVSINLAGISNSQTSTGTAGATTVDFSSTQFLDFANGNATISIHGNGDFNNLTISTPGFTFTDLDFRALFTGNVNGDVNVTGDVGTTSVGSTSTTVSNGAQELLVTSTTPLTSLVLTSVAGFSQLKNFDLSGLTATTPLPATLPLFAGGLGLVGYLTRRRKRRGKQAPAAA